MWSNISNIIVSYSPHEESFLDHKSTELTTSHDLTKVALRSEAQFTNLQTECVMEGCGLVSVCEEELRTHI